MNETARKHRSLPEKIFSLETLLGLIGLGILVGGALRGSVMGMFYGGVTLVGMVFLHLVRKKDWQKHWAELEQHNLNKKKSAGGGDGHGRKE